ncbi:MAG: DUF58 domain-containing protein [Faecalibacterium sp.]
MLLLLIAAILLAFLAQWYLLEHGLDRVHFSQHTAGNLVEPEVPFTVYTTLENRKKFLPVLLQVQERLPEELTILGRVENSRVSLYRVRYYEYCQYLRRCAKVQRSYQAALPARGRYMFRGAVLKGNDFFGTQESTLQVDGEIEMVVLPKRLDVIALEEMLGGFLGDVSVRRYIMEDPTLHTGFRDYTGREPMRAISWSQSAKGQGLMVKQYDHTTDPVITLLLSVAGGTPEELEVCFSMVRTICETLEEKHIRYDFFTNAIMVNAPRASRHVGEGLGAQHLNTILEGLGRSTYHSAEPLHRMLYRASERVNETSCLVILPHADTTAQAEIQRFFAHTSGMLRLITAQEVLS